jgi:hypothetical protein
MFDYPLVLNPDTQYGQLSITPDATPAEIRNAKTELANSYSAQMRQHKTRLAAVESALPELPQLKGKVKALRDDAKANPAALKQAQRDLAEAERRALDIDPGYRPALDELEKLEKKMNEVNSIKLDDEEARRKYDLGTPPCALLKLSEEGQALFDDRRTMLAVVRRELSMFIEDELGVPCFHPTDETRRSFCTDFEPNDTLDRGRL